MKLFNSYTNTVEEFKPIEENKVKMYVCGPTVYDYAHLGHARCYITWDVLYRYLKFKGYDVTYCRNVTDVDDKILKKADKEGKTPTEVSQYWYKQFENSMKALNTLKPDIEPFATKTLGEMIAMVKTLIEKGFAYESNGDVYFRVKKFPKYGYLSKQPIDQLESGARIEVGDQKEDPLDFALWKKDEKFGYKSPWGVGRPGWHIECSAMSTKYLGEEFDIHTGGIDLVPTHHENEIAQNKGACGKNPAHYWIHGEYLLINGGKMSKSLGNTYLIDDIIARGYSPLAYRLFNYSCHYRGKLNFTWEGIESANTSLIRLRDGYQKHLNGNAEVSDEIIKDMENRFHQAINDDMNMPLALSVVWEAVKYPEKSPKIAQLLKKFDTVLGIKIDEVEVQETKIPQEILDLVEERKQARSDKNWSESDRLRDLIAEKGYIVKDTKYGTEILKK